MKKILMFVMSALALGGAPATSWSQAYPNRSIKMIVPFPPAGAADVTAQEVGINNMSISPWGGLYGPVGISKEVVNRVALAMKNVAARKDVREQLGTIAFELQSSTPAEMDRFNRDQLETWRKTADAINLERN